MNRKTQRNLAILKTVTLRRTYKDMNGKPRIRFTVVHPARSEVQRSSLLRLDHRRIPRAQAHNLFLSLALSVIIIRSSR